MKYLIILICTLLTSFALADEVSTEMDGASKALGASFVSEISFDHGSAALTENTREEIRELIKNAKASGKQIDKIQIAAWADREYPAKDTKASPADVDLANQRIKQIKNFMKADLKVSNISAVNMSKRPNSLQKLLNTSENKTKNAMEANGAAPVTTDQTGLLGQKAQASKAVMMVYLE